MIILTDEIKKKIVRDLSRDIRLSEFSFTFHDTVLHCISKDSGTMTIHYDVIPKHCSYTTLLKCAKQYLYEQMLIYNSVRKDLKEMTYEAFIQTILVYKRKEQPIDCNCFYEKDKNFFQFTVSTEIFRDTFNQEAEVLITHDVLEAHGVDIATFLNDVAKCYMKEGINILDNSFPAV